MISPKKLLTLAALMVAVLSGFAQGTISSLTTNAPILSVFIQPNNQREGRDPFYPESLRPYANAVVTNIAPVETLTIRGFSGTSADRTVIINNHSFGVGDEGDVLANGARLHLRCLAINANSVVIEANHQRRELTFTTE